jgi:hypothetical protein
VPGAAGVTVKRRSVPKVFTYVELFKLTPKGRENRIDVPKYLEKIKTIIAKEGSTTMF